MQMHWRHKKKVVNWLVARSPLFRSIYYRHYVLHCLHMPHCSPVISFKTHVSCGTHLLDHLAADGAGLAGGQVAALSAVQQIVYIQQSFGGQIDG